MTPYEKQLHEAIRKANGYGQESPPQQMLLLVNNTEDIATEVVNEGAHALFDAMEKDFGFITLARHTNKSLIQSDFDKLVGLIRWLKHQLEQFNKNQPSSAQLISYLVTTAFLDHDRVLWRELPLRDSGCQGFFISLELLIENSQCFFTSRGSLVPIWEQETLKQFEEADSKGDFIGIEKYWLSLESACSSHFLIKQSVLCLAYQDFSQLVALCDRCNKTIKAMSIADALPNVMRFNLALNSSSSWVRYACIYKGIKNRRQRRGFRRVSQNLLVLTLIKMAQDEHFWKQIMTVFNEYPVRYPALQTALGQALAKTSHTARNAYVDAISCGLLCSIGREEVASCLGTFRRHAGVDERRQIFEHCYHRWEEIVMRPKADDYIFEPFTTILDYGVVAYIKEFIDHKEIAVTVEDIISKIRTLDFEWYASKTAYLTVYNMLLSRMQPFIHALRIHKNGQSMLMNKRYIASFLQEPYMKLKNGER